MDGVNVLRKIRAQEDQSDLPVIAVTAAVTEGERERFPEAGGTEYLTKPVDEAELLAAIQRWIRSRPRKST